MTRVRQRTDRRPGATVAIAGMQLHGLLTWFSGDHPEDIAPHREVP
jgi:hypothetical protein